MNYYEIIDQLKVQAKDLINYLKKEDSRVDTEALSDNYYFDQFAANVGWEDWMEEYVEDEDYITEREHDEIEKILREAWNEVVKELEE